MDEDIYLLFSGRFDEEVNGITASFSDAIHLEPPPTELIREMTEQLSVDLKRSGPSELENTHALHIPNVQQNTGTRHQETAANVLFRQPIPGTSGITIHPDAALFFTACELVRPFAFTVWFQFSVKEPKEGQRRFSYSHQNFLTKSMPVWQSQWSSDPEPFTSEDLELVADHFSTISSLDQGSAPHLSQALRAYSRILFIEEWDWAFLNLWFVLEALFPPNHELRHQLAEFTATLLHEPGMDRMETYNRVKDYYGTRSKIAHGSDANLSKKDALNMTRELSDCCRGVLAEILANDDLLSAYTSGKSSKPILDAVRRRLFGVEPE